MQAPEEVSAEPWRSLSAVFQSIAARGAGSRPEVMRLTGLGRSVVAERISELRERGLVEEGPAAASTGGRPARVLQLSPTSPLILVAQLGASTLRVGLADLSGRVLEHRAELLPIASGPRVVLSTVKARFASLIASAEPRRTVWGISIGLPGPVEFATGLPTSPPIMPGWDRYPVRRVLESDFGLPVWVDNDVNMMAIGEHRRGAGVGLRDVIFVKVGTGIGAGLITGGRIHRGARGAAGDIGHAAIDPDSTEQCRCGNYGCLEIYASGASLVRAAEEGARDGRSPWLAARLARREQLSIGDLIEAGEHGDAIATSLLDSSAVAVGRMVATLVNVYNPEMVVFGGRVADAGDSYLAAIRRVVHMRSLPLATSELLIVQAQDAGLAGLHGAAALASGALMAPHSLPLWWRTGRPVTLGNNRSSGHRQ